jgi:hypothetical protein
LTYGLLGAGIGAGAGAISQMFRPKEKRRPLSGILSGGLLGAGLGAGGSMLHSGYQDWSTTSEADEALTRGKANE